MKFSLLWPTLSICHDCRNVPLADFTLRWNPYSSSSRSTRQSSILHWRSYILLPGHGKRSSLISAGECHLSLICICQTCYTAAWAAWLIYIQFGRGKIPRTRPHIFHVYGEDLSFTPGALPWRNCKKGWFFNQCPGGGLWDRLILRSGDDAGGQNMDHHKDTANRLPHWAR